MLVVDDDPGVRAVARRLFESHGHDVLVASSGAEALVVANQNRTAIDLILMDVVMPLMGGPEAAGVLRREGFRTPVLFMSGYTGDHRGATRLLEDCDRLLLKPFRNLSTTLRHQPRSFSEPRLL